MFVSRFLLLLGSFLCVYRGWRVFHLRALGAALGWTVNVIEVSSSDAGAVESRAPRTDLRTLVGLIATDGAGEVVPSEEVTK